MYKTKFGLEEFFDNLLYKEIGFYANSNWRFWLKDSSEDFRSELYVLCLEHIKAIEKMAQKSLSNHSVEIVSKGLQDAHTIFTIRKSFTTQLKTFLKFRMIRATEEKNRLKFMDLKNNNRMIKDEVFRELIVKAKIENIPVELLDFYNLAYLSRIEAIRRVCVKHNITRDTFNWRRQNWCYIQLTLQEKALKAFKPIEEYEHDVSYETTNNIKVMTIIAFDKFDDGHKELLNKMSEAGETLVVGVNSDKLESNHTPLSNEAERIKAIKAYTETYLNVKVITFLYDNAYNLTVDIKQHKPNVYFNVHDYNTIELNPLTAYSQTNVQSWFDSEDIILTNLTINREATNNE